MGNFLLKITIFVFAGVALAACGGVTSTTESFAESPTLLPDPTDVPEPTDVPIPTATISPLLSVRNAVVYIEAQSTYVDPLEGQLYNVPGTGTGVVVNSTGIAITNNHVVQGAGLLRVWVAGESSPRNARIVGVSECSDIAIIDIDGEGFEYPLNICCISFQDILI